MNARAAAIGFTSAMLVVSVLLQPGRAAEPLTNSLAPLYHSSFQYVGSLSCAAAACHQAPRPGVASPLLPRGSEFGLWAENDPHATARDTLDTDESRAMLMRLGILRDGRIADQQGYDNCLRCHSLKPADNQQPDNWNTSESVSCEVCHGPAEKWLNEHTRSDWTTEQAAEAGMLKTQDLLVRARLCSDCHVGSADREVNHDMIAAGHPALRFEMSADHARLPKHWRDANEDDPDYEWSLWLAGQVASAEAALALSHARLSDKAVYRVWPEFSEYNCGDCHHALDVPTARQRPGYAARTIPRWGDWYFSSLRQVQPQMIESLSQQMTLAFAHKSDAAAELVMAARQQLDPWIERERADLFQRDYLQRRGADMDQVLRGQIERGLGSWEEAAQIYLVLRARDAARWRALDPQHPKLASLLRMRESLKFDEARDYRMFFSDPRGDDAIPYDQFLQELEQYFRPLQR